MLKVHILSHKDGDHLAIVESPRWTDIYEWLINRICPCCGITGWISGRWDWFAGFTYRIWNGLLGIQLKFDKELFRVPIESACIASEAIWGDHGDLCWRDDCPVINRQDDA